MRRHIENNMSISKEAVTAVQAGEYTVFLSMRSTPVGGQALSF